MKSVASAIDFSPDHFRRKSTRLVSYYALFKGMAASKPTSQLSERIHILNFSTESVLWDLSRRSGFLPSRSRTLSHGSCLPGRSEEHTSELQSRLRLVCRLLLETSKE